MERSGYPLMPQPVVYILYSKSLDKYYVGSTIDFERRFHEHTHYTKHFTAMARDWEAVFVEPCEMLAIARRKEYWLKRQKSRQLIMRIVQEQRCEKPF